MKKNLLIILIACIFTLQLMLNFPSALYAQDIASVEDIPAGEIYKKAVAKLNSVRTVRGRFKRSLTVGAQAVNYEGRFVFRQPGDLFFEFALPELQLISKTGSSFTAYYPDKKKAFKIDLTNVSPYDKSLIGSAVDLPLTMLNDFKTGFSFSMSDTMDNSYIIKAVPGSEPERLSHALIKIEKKRFRLSAVELFNKKNDLFSQTLFLNYKKFKNSPGGSAGGKEPEFPVKIENRVIVESVLYEEIMNFSRISINSTVDEKTFILVLPAGVKIETLKKETKKDTGKNIKKNR